MTTLNLVLFAIGTVLTIIQTTNENYNRILKLIGVLFLVASILLTDRIQNNKEIEILQLEKDKVARDSQLVNLQKEISLQIDENIKTDSINNVLTENLVALSHSILDLEKQLLKFSKSQFQKIRLPKLELLEYEYDDEYDVLRLKMKNNGKEPIHNIKIRHNCHYYNKSIPIDEGESSIEMLLNGYDFEKTIWISQYSLLMVAGEKISYSKKDLIEAKKIRYSKRTDLFVELYYDWNNNTYKGPKLYFKFYNDKPVLQLRKLKQEQEIKPIQFKSK